MRTLLRWLRRLVLAAAALAAVAGAALAGLVWATVPGGNLAASIPGLSVRQLMWRSWC